MDYDLPEETEEFRKVVRSFAEEVVRPVAEHYDARSEFPLEVVRQMGELGLFGLVLPERYGGADAEFITLCVAIEELAAAGVPIAGATEPGRSTARRPVGRAPRASAAPPPGCR